jgi:hypothetical protein
MNFFRKFTHAAVSFVAVMTLAVPLVAVHAQAAGQTGTSVTSRITSGLNAAAAGYGQQPTTDQLPTIIGRLIGVAIGFLGVVLLLYLLWGGFIWMTAGGDEKKVGKARDMIKNAIIGLVIIVAAYSIASYVVVQLSGAITGGTGT